MTGLRELARRLRRRPPEAPEPALEPERPVRAPLPHADATEAVTPFSAGEEERLHILADWLRSASPGTQDLGTAMADWLRKEVPDVRDADLARVLLAAGWFLADAADEQDDDHAALRVVADALLGVPAALAEFDLTLTQERRW